MSVSPSIAIVIPAFNAAAYLSATIDRGLSQTLPAAQVIVVNDGSTDGTATIAAAFGDAVTVLSQENAGVSEARNLGANAAVTDWFLFLDADDLLRPDALERLASRANEPQLGVIYGQSEYFSDEKPARRAHGKANAEGPIPSAVQANFWKSCVATPGGAIVRASVFRDAGEFRREFNTAADRDFWLRAGMISEFGFVNAPVIEKREHTLNMSADKNRARKQGAEVQLGFLHWCKERGFTPPAVNERQIVERNLDRALLERAFQAAAWLCEEADRRHIESPAVRRARRVLKAHPFVREIQLRLRALVSR